MTDKQLLEALVKGQEELKLEVGQIRKAVREEVEIEAKKTRDDALLAQSHLNVQLDDLGDTIKDLQISGKRLEKGQEELKKELQEQGKVLNAHSKILNEHGNILNEHGKSLKSINKLLNKTASTVDIIGLRYDERLVENELRIDRIDNHLGLPSFKSKQ